MQSSNIPFQIINCNDIDEVIHPGTTGTALWKTLQFDGLRVRVVEYSADYLADHWCQKGHVVHCLDGEFTTELQTGETSN